MLRTCQLAPHLRGIGVLLAAGLIASMAPTRASAQTEDVIFRSAVGVTVSGNDLTKTAAAGWNNAGAVSVQTLESNGFVEFSGASGAAFVVGLSYGDTNQTREDIDFGIYLTGTQAIVYQGGAQPYNAGSYTTSDKFRIEAAGNVVRYRKNGVILYTSATAARFPLLVDVAINTVGSAVVDARIGQTTVSAEAGLTTSEGTLTKTAAVGWNAGAVSARRIPWRDGSVEFTAIETNKLRAAGLSNGDTDKTAADIDFAILLRADGIVEIQEGGTSRGTFGSYTTNDRFRVVVQNGVVTYLRNSSLMYTSSVAPVFPLWADTALYDVGATLSDLVVSEISWTSTASVIVSAGTLTKTGSAGWNGGASSTASLASGDGFVEFTASETNTTRACGLADSVSSYDPAQIDFAIQLQSNGNAQVYESGTPRGTASTYASGDRFRVEVQYGVVKYRKNGVVFYTSLLAPSYPLSVDAVLDTVGGTLREVRLGRLVFRNDVGVAVWGYSLLNTAATGWGNSGASSTLELASGDGWVEYTATDVSSSRTLGLSNGDSNRNYNEIDFGLSAWNGTLWAHQNGSPIGSCCGSFAVGDRLRIAVEGGVVKYRKNGALLATSSQTVQYPLLVDTALNTSGTSLTDIVVSPSFTSSTLIVPPLGLTPGAGTYNIAQSVMVTCDLVGIDAHYTTNGVDPTQTDPTVACGGTVSVGQSLTLKVKGWKAGHIPSVVTTAAYTMVVGTPSFSPPPGAYTGIQSVALSTVTTGATISYTTNGVDPGPGSPSGTSVNVDHTLILKAKATKAGWTDSNLTWGTYVITVGTVATPTLSPPGGSYPAAQTVTLSCSTSGALIRYTLDGTDPTFTSPVYSAPISVPSSRTIKARAYNLDWAPSAVRTDTYTIAAGGAADPPVLSMASGRYANGLRVTVTSPMAGTTIRYTTNGLDPTDTDPVVASGGTLQIERSLRLKARVWKTGLQPSAVAYADYEIVGAVAAGASHGVALRADGTVATWGYNTSGQLGDGTITNRSTPVTVTGGLDDVIAVSAGENHSVALKQDGTVWCWGDNGGGVLGAGIPDAYRTSPVQVITASGPLTGITAISAGMIHTMALKSDGTVWVWGGNVYGVLGQGNQTSQSRAVQVPGLSGITAIAAGRWHSLALQTNGSSSGYVWSWGLNDSGQLLDDTTTNRLSPVLGPGQISLLGAGAQHTVVRKAGAIWGAGLNNFGQLGNGTTVTPQSTLAPAMSGVTGVTKIAAGGHVTLAMTAAGEVWATGYNVNGPLGDGTTVNKSTPVRTVVLRETVDVVANISSIGNLNNGIAFSLALTADGRVWSWGANTYYGLASGGAQADHRYRPQPIANFSVADQTWPLGDSDGDGLLNKDEAVAGTDPFNADTNGDGIGDGTAVRSGLSPTSLDMDGDGVTNTVERTTKGTDPLRADTDGDGVADGADCFPLDPTRTTCPPPIPGDVTPPVITLTEPLSAILISSLP